LQQFDALVTELLSGITPPKNPNKRSALAAGAAKMVAVLGSHLMTLMHQERPVAARGLPQMETPDQYREFAAECLRLASVARTEEHRKILREMARGWTKVAEDAEQKERQS
jgi:hypothetical protein